MTTWPPETSAALATRLRFIVDALSPRRPRALLDIGCGTGEQLTRHLATFFPEASVHGVDSDAPSIAYARERFASSSNARFFTDVPADVYDAVVASEVLEHVEDPRGFLEFLRGKLKDDGFLILTVPNGYGSSEWMAAAHGLLTASGLWGFLQRAKARVGGSARTSDPAGETLAASPHINFFRFRELHRLLRETGFRPRQYRGRMVLHNFLFSMILDRNERLSRWNARAAASLPPALVSDWMFVLEKAPPAPATVYRRNAYARWRRRLAEKTAAPAS